MTRLHIRLNDSSDSDIIRWLDSQRDKTAAVKNAIRAAMTSTPSRDEATSLDLDAVRTILESVLDERLSGLALAAMGQSSKDEDPETAAKLDAMF